MPASLVHVREITSSNDAEKVFEEISSSNLKKESLKQRNNFMRECVQTVQPLLEPKLVKAVYDSEATQYDADSEFLTIFQYARDNVATGWDKAFNYRRD